MDFVRLTTNLAGPIRYETWHGRKYIVAPLTMIVPGVLPGSRGPLLYPPHEVALNHEAWDGIPIVVNHPVDESGNPVQARQPWVLEKYGIGYVFNTRFDGKLRAEGWFDIERCKKVRPSVLSALQTGRKQELSTGLYTKNLPAQNGAHHNGVPYSGIATNYRPDHLAILPDSTGACSIKHGCGVLATNAKKPKYSVTLPNVTPDKACKILKDRKVNGHPLTKKQRGLFGIVCGRRKKPTTKNEGPPMTIGASLLRGIAALGELTGDAEEVEVANSPTGEPTNATTVHVVGNELSHEQLRSALWSELKDQFTQADPTCYITDIFDDYLVYEQGGKMYRMGYSKTDTGVSLDGDPVEVIREVRFNPVDNSATPNGEPNMGRLNDHERAQIADRLVGNCSCPANMPWKGKDKATLLQLSDELLTSYDQTRNALVGNNTPAGGVPGSFVDGHGHRHSYNQATRQWETTIPSAAPTQNQAQPTPPTPTQPAAPAPAGPTGNAAPVVPTAPVVQTPKSLTEALQMYGTAEDKAVWASAVAIHNGAKGQLVQKLLNHFRLEGEARTAAEATYNSMPLPTLQTLTSGIPAEAPPETPAPPINNYFGALGAPPAPTVNETPLLPPVYQFGKA